MNIHKTIVMVSLLVFAAALLSSVAAPRMQGDAIPKLIVFIVVSVVLVYVSRASLRLPRSHGFYRFFAWEAILGLTLLVLDTWFFDPFSWHQIISWWLLAVSLLLAIHGVHLLRGIGKQDIRRDDTPMLEFEKKLASIVGGRYRI